MNLLKYSLLLVIMISTSSCDPALRLKIINKSGETVEFKQKEFFPEVLVDNIYNDTNKVIVLNSSIDSSYTEFYGIGTWSETNQEIMMTYLDSLLFVKLGKEVKSKSTLEEFGNSLMIYEFEK